MALILNIDTALDVATLSLAENGVVLETMKNHEQKDHASWIHSAIKELLLKSKRSIDQLNAVAVSNGPGSYTGLRVGLSTAKGLCYALNIPLIAINTLEVIARSGLQHSTSDALICPMIDARRMEVFTAVYNSKMEEILKPSAVILNEHSFDELLKWQKILFLGNGSEKFRQVCQHPNTEFKNLPLDASTMATMSYSNFIGNNFAGLAYAEPLYLKEFYSRQ